MRDTEQIQRHDPYFDDEIDLKELFNVLWTAKRLIILITSIFAIGSVVYSLSLNNHYKSESLLLARSVSGTQGLTQYSNLAAMAGINLPTTAEDKTAQTIELIKSRKFVKHLLTFENILPSILAAKSYNSVSEELLFDQEQYESETKTWKNKPKNNRSVIPSYLKAHRAYSGMLSIAQDNKTGFISISIEHISPVFAKDFLELIIREANELLRKKDMEESKQGLEYLTSELSKTPFVDIKESINALIEAQIETQMLAKIHQDYILIEIEPPFIPEEKSKPSRAIICILGTMLGGMLSVLIVLIRHYAFAEKEQAVE
ncbi:MAG: LPS O-antigen length regulator [Acidiferrobacteraceae bacterium]|nr:LPS O-antigen length regulator [Acidiferrobacteraceae bacterium]|tara:strand:- start:46 stop:993 length:948 start_codon:yes stop_codon:yes gene_type:complete